MTMFGVDIKIKPFKSDTSFIEDVACDAIKKSEERKVFGEFLDSETTSGIKVVNTIERIAKHEAIKPPDGGMSTSTQTLFDFALSRLKSKSDGKSSIYDNLVRKIIEAQNPKFKKLHKQLDTGVFDGKLPFGYPDASKKAQGILTAKIKDSLPKIEADYLEQKLISEKIKELAREMFYGINKLGLEGDQLVKYLGIIYELDLLKEAPFLNIADLKNMIGRSIKSSEDLNLLYVKCLRFAYPKSGGVNVIPNMEDTINEGKQGRILLKSEKDLQVKLKNIKQIFESRDIKTNFVICIADEDIDLLFPEGNPFVDLEGLKLAKINTEKYVESAKMNLGSGFEVATTNLLSSRTYGKYKDFRNEIIRSIKSRSGKYIDINLFEKSRVDYQYSFYQKLLGPDFSRDMARRTAEEQVTSVIALQEILKLYGKNVILVEENRGDENKLIANGSVPIIFTKLRADAKFDVK